MGNVGGDKIGEELAQGLGLLALKEGDLALHGLDHALGVGAEPGLGGLGGLNVAVEELELRDAALVRGDEAALAHEGRELDGGRGVRRQDAVRVLHRDLERLAQARELPHGLAQRRILALDDLLLQVREPFRGGANLRENGAHRRAREAVYGGALREGAPNLAHRLDKIVPPPRKELHRAAKVVQVVLQSQRARLDRGHLDRSLREGVVVPAVPAVVDPLRAVRAPASIAAVSGIAAAAIAAAVMVAVGTARGDRGRVRQHLAHRPERAKDALRDGRRRGLAHPVVVERLVGLLQKDLEVPRARQDRMARNPERG